MFQKKLCVSAGVALLIGWLLVQPGSAHPPLEAGRQGEQPAGESLVFLDPGELHLVLPKDTDKTSQVVVVLSAVVSGPVQVELAGLVSERGEQLPVEAVTGLPVQIIPDEYGRADFRLNVVRVAGVTGSFAGQVVAYRADGAVARRALVIDFESETLAAQASDNTGLNPRFLSEFHLGVTSNLPSLRKPVGESHSQPPTIQVAEVYSRAQTLVGALSGPQGEIAEVWLSGRELRIERLMQAGSYQGKIDLLPEDEAQGEMSLKVEVRDHIAWAIVVLSIGLLLTAGIENLVRVKRPRLRLELRLVEAKEEALGIQEEATKQLPPVWPYGQKVLRIYDRDEPVNLLENASLELLKNFDDADSDAERDKYGPHSEAADKVNGYVGIMQEGHNLSLAVWVNYRKMQQNLAAMKQALEAAWPNNPEKWHYLPDFDQLPVAEQAKLALKAELLTNATELAKWMTALQDAATFMDAFTKLYLLVQRLQHLASNPDEVRETDTLMLRLLSKAIVNEGLLEPLSADAERLRIKIVAAASSPYTVYSAPGQGVSPRVAIDLPLLVDLRQWLGSKGIVEQPAVETPAELRARLQEYDVQYWLFTTAVVLGTGLATLYLPNATFGSALDYLNLALWGTAVGEGLQIARRISLPGLARWLGG